MATPDMEVIKEIPGYKVILKAVLKSQIQQLVEQLASTTDEESVILTASVSDGTLSHLGSDSGKGFLEDHEDIKSQFLGFCLKKHHRKKQEEKDKQEAEALQFSMQASPSRFGAARFPQSGVHRQVHPVSMVRASPVSNIGGNVRHEPYPVSRPGRRHSGSLNQTTKVASSPSTETKDEQVIKQESEVCNDSVATPSKTIPGDNDDDNSNTFTDEPQNESVGPDSDLSNVNAGSNPEHSESGENDINVKLEAITEAEMDLEITGVEPGRPMLPQDTWDPNVSMATNYDPNMTGAMTSQQADTQNDQTGAETEKFFATVKLHSCQICHMIFPRSSLLTNHMKTHWTNKGKSIVTAAERVAFKLTGKVHSCEHCGKVFPRPANLETHIRVHTGEKPYLCSFCGMKFTQKVLLQEHNLKCHQSDAF